MKKIYRIEEEKKFNGGLKDCQTYDEALIFLTKILHDEANYNYQINKDNVYSICEVNVINENEDDYEEEYFDTLISVSVKEYKDMNYKEKAEKGLN